MQIGYVIVYVPDVAAAVAFYERAFGLSRRFVHESGYGELETGSTVLAFAAEALIASQGITFQPNRRSTPAAGVEVALVTEDPAAAYRKAIEAGAEPVQPPTQQPWGQTVAHVRDCSGLLVELCSPVGPPDHAAS